MKFGISTLTFVYIDAREDNVMTRIFGYARISTAKQSIERQRRNILAAFPDAVIIEEVYTGTTTDRPRWARLEKTAVMEAAAGHDVTIVFDSVSRMSRDAEEGFKLYQALYDAGVDLVFIKEHHIDTQTYKRSLEIALPQTGTAVDLLLDGVRAYLMELAKEQIRLAFAQAQKEVDDLHKRTSEGIMTAKLAGKQIGRKPGARITTAKQKKAEEIIQRCSRDFSGSLSDAECQRLAGVSRNSYYKYKKNLWKKI
jgi:DNA invertase Pin-like site-specific DNA recombinase